MDEEGCFDSYEITKMVDCSDGGRGYMEEEELDEEDWNIVNGVMELCFPKN